jgi:hypothetical protein
VKQRKAADQNGPGGVAPTSAKGTQ